jgi:hypothetical protein
MLVRKCDNCKKEIKHRDEKVVVGLGWPEFFLRTLRKANRRVPEETQACPAQDDRIATIGFLIPQWTATGGVVFSLAFFLR